MMTKKQAEKAAKAHGLSPAAAAQMLKWRAGGAASNAWLERYQEQAKAAGSRHNQNGGV